MKKLLLFAAVAAMALSASADGYKVEQLWKHTDGLPTVGDARQGVGMNGKIYINVKGDEPKVVVFGQGGLADEEYPGGANCGISVDEAGNLVILNNAFPGVFGEGAGIRVVNLATSEATDYEFPAISLGRCDFVGFCKGNLLDDGEIYLVGHSNDGPSTGQAVAKVTISGGELSEDDTYLASVDGVTPTSSNVVSYFVNPDGEDRLLYMNRTQINGGGNVGLKILAPDGEGFVVESTPVLPGKSASNGGQIFVWDGAEYAVYPAGGNYKDGFAIIKLGDEEALYTQADLLTVNPNGFQANWVNAEVVEDGVNIYHYVPGAYVEMLKLTKDEEPVGPETMNLVGSMTNNWDINNPEAMTKTDDGVFTITKEFAVGDEMKFVITPGSWDDANVFGADSNGAFELSENYIGGQDLALAQPGQNFKVMVAGEYEVVVDPVNMKAYFTKSETPVVDELYIVGNFTGEAPGWDITQAEAMTAEDGKFTITKTFAAGDEFKLVGEKAWNDATTFGGQDDNNVGYFKVDDFLGGNITMVNPGANFKVEAAGEYKLVADKENKVLVVTGLNIPITDIVVPTEVTIALGGETYQIEAQVVPATATEGLTYTSSDEQVVTVDNTGLVTAVKSGTWEVAFRAPGIKEVQPATATVTVAADAVNATAAPVSKDIAFTVTNPTGVKNIGVAKTVASKKYVNAAGMVSDKAFDGMNIIVTTYSDGSRAVEKVVK